MTAHPATSTVRVVRRYRGRWVVYLSCGHRVRVYIGGDERKVNRPRVGSVFPCPEKPIGIVLVDDVTGKETPYDPFQRDV